MFNESDRFTTFAEYVEAAFAPVHVVARGVAQDHNVNQDHALALAGALLFARMRLEQLTEALGREYLLELEPGTHPGEAVPLAIKAGHDLEVPGCA